MCASFLLVFYWDVIQKERGDFHSETSATLTVCFLNLTGVGKGAPEALMVAEFKV